MEQCMKKASLKKKLKHTLHAPCGRGENGEALAFSQTESSLVFSLEAIEGALRTGIHFAFDGREGGPKDFLVTGPQVVAGHDFESFSVWAYDVGDAGLVLHVIKTIGDQR